MHELALASEEEARIQTALRISKTQVVLLHFTSNYLQFNVHSTEIIVIGAIVCSISCVESSRFKNMLVPTTMCFCECTV